MSVQTRQVVEQPLTFAESILAEFDDVRAALAEQLGVDESVALEEFLGEPVDEELEEGVGARTDYDPYGYATRQFGNTEATKAVDRKYHRDGAEYRRYSRSTEPSDFKTKYGAVAHLVSKDTDSAEVEARKEAGRKERYATEKRKADVQDVRMARLLRDTGNSKVGSVEVDALERNVNMSDKDHKKAEKERLRKLRRSGGKEES
jgi:hypothetical protein